MNRRTKVVAGASALLLGGGVAFATTSWAAIPDSDDQEYHACVENNPSVGSMRKVYIIDKQAGQNCISFGHTEKVWNKEGPAGPQGPAGPAGEDGAPVDYYTRSLGSDFNGDQDTVTTGSKSVFCDEGDLATGGGGEESSNSSISLSTSVHTFGESGLSGWRVTYKADHDGGVHPFFVSVRCADLNQE